MKDYSVYLKDIIANIEIAQRFIVGLTFETFITDDKTTYAVIRCLEIIGEATKRLPYNLRQQHPEVPWKSMAGARDIMAHDYASIIMKKVWQMAKFDLPELKPQIQKILADFK